MTRLRPIRQNDVSTLAAWRNDPTSMHLWETRRAMVSHERALEEIDQDMRGDKHIWLMAENRRHDTIGMVYSYDAQFVDEHCFTTTFIDAGFRGIGHGPEIQAMFLNYLFSYFNFRKVYYDVYGYNVMSLKAIETFGLTEEGQFLERRYFDGSWYPLIRYALYRRDLDRIRQFLEKRQPRQNQRAA